MSASKIAHDRILEIYSRYPKKLGKSAGMRTAITQCKTPEKLELLDQAVTNYIAHIAKEGTERQYIMYFSTFMSQWRDWLDSDVGTVHSTTIDLNGIDFDPK